MIIRYIRAWIHKYILHIKSPSAYIAGWEHEWDLITKGARWNAPYKAESNKEKDVNSTDLCKSCNTKGCIFQSGIVRSHCDFYKAESEEEE